MLPICMHTIKLMESISILFLGIPPLLLQFLHHILCHFQEFSLTSRFGGEASGRFNEEKRQQQPAIRRKCINNFWYFMEWSRHQPYTGGHQVYLHCLATPEDVSGQDFLYVLQGLLHVRGSMMSVIPWINSCLRTCVESDSEDCHIHLLTTSILGFPVGFWEIWVPATLFGTGSVPLSPPEKKQPKLSNRDQQGIILCLGDGALENGSIAALKPKGVWGCAGGKT